MVRLEWVSYMEKTTTTTTKKTKGKIRNNNKYSSVHTTYRIDITTYFSFWPSLNDQRKVYKLTNNQYKYIYI